MAIRQLAPNAVGGELERIRRDAVQANAVAAAVGQASRQLKPQARATLANLVLLVSDYHSGYSAEEVQELIAKLSKSHPSRFFVVRYAKSGEGSFLKKQASPLDTAVYSRRVRTLAGADIATEEVLIDVSGKGVSLVPNFLLSLLVPDVDSVCLLLCDPGGGANKAAIEPAVFESFGDLLSGIATVSDLVLYDSAMFTDYDHSFSVLQRLETSKPASSFMGGALTGRVVRDVNWLRLRRWQELLAEQIDSQRHIAEPWSVGAVRLFFEGGNLDTTSPDALLLASWCAVSLGWKLDGVREKGEKTIAISAVDDHRRQGVLELSCRTPSGQGSVSSLAKDKTIPNLSELELELQGEKLNLRVSLQHLPDKQQAELALEVIQDANKTNACDVDFRRVPFFQPAFEDIVRFSITPQAENLCFKRANEFALELARLL